MYFKNELKYSWYTWSVSSEREKKQYSRQMDPFGFYLYEQTLNFYFGKQRV